MKRVLANRIVLKRLNKSGGLLIIVLISLLSFSFKKQESTPQKIKEFVLEIVENDNEKILQKYFRKVHEDEVREAMFDYFKAVRQEYLGHKEENIIVTHKEKNQYMIKMGDSQHSILIYKTLFKLKIKSVIPLSKGNVLIGWVYANVKFKDDSDNE